MKLTGKFINFFFVMETTFNVCFYLTVTLFGLLKDIITYLDDSMNSDT